MKKLLIYISIILIIFPLFGETETNWVIAAEKFTYAKGYVQTAVSDASAEMLPMNILEKLNRTIERNILPDEKFQRDTYKLRVERQSLYLQLSSEYRKRDALFLEAYTDKELAVQIKNKDKDIKTIQDKINENLDNVKKYQLESEENMKLIESGKVESKNTNVTELQVIRNFFHNIFLKDDSVITQEKVNIYKNDFANLYKASEEASELGYLSTKYEKEIINSGINTLIAGNISGFGDYISVTVDLYLYPGAKKVGSITEIGTLQDADLITSSIASQLIPMITNAMPVLVNISVAPDKAAANVHFYIDDVLQNTDSSSYVLESGIHTIQFVSDGYRTVETTYSFTGNTTYNIEIDFKEQMDGFLQIELVKPIIGDFLANGEGGQKINDQKTQIKINGKKILGEFIAEDGNGAFFYIPEKLVYNENVVKLKPKAYDRAKNIDKRRKWMYGSYSMLMLSLIPTFYTYGNLINDAKLFNEGLMSYDEAMKMQNAANICQYISIGCGVLFAFELVRYFMAANAVLPQKATHGNINDFEQYSPSDIQTDKENTENITDDKDSESMNKL